MASILNTLKDSGVSLPNFSFAGASQYIIYFLVGLLFAGVIGVGFFFLYNYYKYNITIKLFKKVGGRILPTGEDKGMLQRVGSAGDYWLITKQFKKKLPRPRIWIAKNTCWYYEREDGEWINFELGDIDSQMKQAGAYYVDEDMRLQRLGIQKNLEERHKKLGFWQQYGTTIMLVIFVVIVTICLVVLFKELKALPGAMADASKSVRDMALAVKDASGCISGGGMSPTG